MKKTVPIVLLIILFAGAAWYSFMKEPDPVHELPPPQVAPALPATEQPPPQTGTEGVYTETESEPVMLPEPLPALGESDPEVTQALADMAGSEPLLDYLVRDQIISRLVASIDSLTSRQVPANINPVRPAGDKFIVDTEGDNLVLSARNFERYDGYVALLRNMDTDQMQAFYDRYYPLFQQAWEQNGGQGSIDDRLLEVIDNLLATPVVDVPVYLTKPEAVYLFEDPELEALTAGQKVLVRMGQENAATVKQKLMEIRSKLSR
jgi:hypothetical protein